MPYTRDLAVWRIVSVLAIGLLACRGVVAGTFSDDFNRPNSSTVGNGWSNTIGNTGGNLAIVNNQLSGTALGGNAGISRPFGLSSPVSVSAQVFEESGFSSNLLRRYTSKFMLS